MNMKMSRDINGNKTVKLSFPGQKVQGFSIQTNGNLPITHRTNEPCRYEIIAWVIQYGTLRQKALIKNY